MRKVCIPDCAILASVRAHVLNCYSIALVDHYPGCIFLCQHCFCWAAKSYGFLLAGNESCYLLVGSLSFPAILWFDALAAHHFDSRGY